MPRGGPGDCTGHCERASIVTYPMADGGEGALETLTRNGRAHRFVSVHDATGVGIQTKLGLLDGATVVLETAGIVGVTDPVAMAVDVAHRHSSGVGQAIRVALDIGKRKILVALGGSSTNDAGAGMLAALSVRFFDRNGKAVESTLATLSTIQRIDASALDSRLRETEILGLSDVENTLSGSLGATAVFGPQKGVSTEQIAEFDGAIVHYAELIEKALQRECRNAVGAGAAGGLGLH